jgi:CheY-like chemotaxis protein/signal transduction histidine kinase/HAMP domain-containing protein
VEIRFKSIKNRLMASFLLAALLPLLIVGVVIYNQRAEYIRFEAFDKLQMIRDLKVGEVNSWIDERMGDVQAFSRIAEIENVDAVLSGAAASRRDSETFRKIADTLNGFREYYQNYSEIFVVSARTGKIAVSTDASRKGKDVTGSRYLTEPLRTGKVYVSDIYESKTLNRPTMEFSFPIRPNGGKGQAPAGVLVARIDMERSVYALLLNRTGLGNTGETLIVDKDLFALNELRWYNRAPLKLMLKTEAAILASQGKTGIVEAVDYRGEAILAAYTHIPRTGWGFIAKMDLKEVYAPIRTLLMSILLLFCLTATAVYLFSLYFSRKRAQPILDMAAVAKRILEGDLSARNPVSSEDEIGFLAESFNHAADSLGLRIEAEKKSADLAETLIHPKDLNEFAGAVLEKFMDITESQLGAFYLCRTGGSRFEPLAAIGVNPDLLGTFDASILEGAFGKALKTQEISHIANISEETPFTFRTFAGTAVPREMISLPVVVKKEVRAMICLASLGAYSKAALAILSQPAMIALNTAFANLLANDETRKLAGELRESNQELQVQHEELEAQAEELRKQTEELQGQNVELEQQRLALEEASRLKSQFLSNMSHELRTPLNSVMALSSVLMMQAKAKLSAEEINYLAIIERNGKNLLTLINDILDLSKIEAGRMDVNPKSFSLHLALENILESIGPLAAEKQIELRQGIPEDLPPLESDEIRVSQILQNIVANAVKFTDAGSVTVSASVSNDHETFSVRIADTGIGIAENDLPYIFDEFRQVDGTSARRHEGTGLGLSIARKAARMLGGEIAVQSAPGQGSAFTLTLPVHWQGTAPVCEPNVIRQPSAMQSNHRTILVVDDEPEMAAIISRYLLQEGYYTLTAASGAEALELAARERPFAVTLDIIMPDMDGWEVLQGLKKNPATKDIPVIIVSISEDGGTGFALGAVGYVSKPVSKAQLLSEIEKIGKPGTRSVMIVDDSDLDRREIRRIVEQEGMKPIEAEDGAVCLELIKKQVPDVLVLDLMMPEPDGFAVLERIRGNPETRDLPVIVVTAKDLTEEDRKKLSGNVVSVLEKSAAKSAALLAEIKRILRDLEGPSQYRGPERRASPPRILLVEDNKAAVIQIKAVIESAGYVADVSRGGQEAFDYVSRTIPDGIILDLMMPEIDGFAVLEKIRGTKATAEIPVLILTAKDLTPEDFKKLSAYRVRQLVQKGDVDRENLLCKVRAMLGIPEPRAPLHDGASGTTELYKKFTRRRGDVKPGDSPDDPSAKASPPPAILVVEDNPDNMTTIKAVLQNRYRILEATDGEEGLLTAAEAKPDLILLDMALPKMDGLTVVRRLKDNRELDHIPVIAMTARVMKGDRESILEAGCDDYVAKPIDPEGFLKKIGEWLKG